jgi:hypothetical protein
LKRGGPLIAPRIFVAALCTHLFTRTLADSLGAFPTVVFGVEEFITAQNTKALGTARILPLPLTRHF